MTRQKKQTIEENLTLEVTTECSSNCTHCFVRATKRDNISMPVQMAKDILDEGFESGYRHLHITGGEPFLWEHFSEIIEYCSSKGYESFFINTSGSAIKKETIETLASLGDACALSISLQGPEKLHNKFRGEGAYQKTIKSIESFLESNLKICIFTVAGKNLLQELPRFAESLFTAFPDIEELTLIQLIRVANDYFDLSEELLSPEDFVVMIRMTSMLNLYGYVLTILENPLAFAASRIMDMPWLAKTPSLHRNGRITLLADGKITVSHSSHEIFGTYKPGILSDIFSSVEYRKSIEADNTVCPYCEFHDLCKEHGMIRPSEWYRDMGNELYCKRVLRKIT